MNHTTRRTRRGLIAFASTAAIVGAGVGIGTGPAHAATSLTLAPTTTSITTLNFGDQILVNALLAPHADATFAMRVTDDPATTTAVKLKFDSYTAPTGVTPVGTPTLFYSQQATGSPDGPLTWTSADGRTLTTPGTTDITPALTEGQDTFLTTNEPGTYTFHFLDEGITAGTDDDVLSPTITMTVKDAFAASASTTDDWVPTVTNSTASAGIGDPITGRVSLSSLTAIDSRGSSSGIGVVSSKCAALLGMAFTGAPAGLSTDLSGGGTDYTATVAVTSALNMGTRLIPVGVTGEAGTVTTTAYFDSAGDASYATAIGNTANTVLATNNVTAVALDAMDVTGTVKEAAGAVSVKTGTASVTYTATITDTDTVKSGNVVYFSLSGTDRASLSTDGTAVDSATTSDPRIYSAVTDATGVATLVVTDSATTRVGYTVDADSNGAAAPLTMTAAYGDAAVGSVEVTSTSGQLHPSVGSPATLSGRVLDQFGGVYQPSGGQIQQVSVLVDVNDPDCAFDTASVTGYSTISSGLFTYTYTPTVTPLVGQCDAFQFNYATGPKTVDSAIQWTSVDSPASVSLTTPITGATGVAVPEFDTVAPVQPDSFGDITAKVSGVVKDASGTAMAYKSVTLTGTDGVYFSTSSTGSDLVTTITPASDVSGIFSAYAFFTKSGPATITATSGTATTTSTVTTVVPTDAYTVTLNAAEVAPSSTTIVSGTVTDMFGNPVTAATVNISNSMTSLGVLSPSAPVTNADGGFSATFTAGSTPGEATLTATLAGQSTNKKPDAIWTTTAALTPLPADGVYTTTAILNVGADVGTELTLTGPTSRSGYGWVTLTGTADPLTEVDIHSKAYGTGSSYLWVDTVTADDTGAFSSMLWVNKSTVFIAKTSTKTSAAHTVTVSSTARLVTAYSHRHGRVYVVSVGGPKGYGYGTLYRVVNGQIVRMQSKKANYWGGIAFDAWSPGRYQLLRVYYWAPGMGVSPAASQTVWVK
jgi:hypothetical protein